MGAGCGFKMDATSQIAGNDMDCNDYYSQRNQEQVQEWLDDLNLSEYYDNFIENGFDKMDIIRSNLQNNTSILREIGIEKIGHQMVIIKSIQKLNDDEYINTLRDDEPLIPTWKCPECGNQNNMTFTKCAECKQSLDTSEKRIIHQLNHSKLELQFPVIEHNNSLDDDDSFAATWKCNNCHNINSNQIIVCLKCNEKKNCNENNRKWTKEAVNV